MQDRDKIQEYIDMRNSGDYNISWFYEHYMESSKDKNMVINKFQAIFNTSNFHSILEHIDRKFNLNRWYDKSGKFIRCDFGPNQS